MSGISLSDRREHKASGIIRMRIYRYGQLVEDYEQANLILASERNILANLIGGTANYAITQFGVGTNGAAPAPGNTTLTNAVKKSFGSVTISGSVTTFAFSMGTGDANGLSISEFGLLTAGNVLYSRQVRSAPLLKDNTISFAGTWSITQ